MKLWQQVLIGLILGVISGIVLGESAAPLKIFGTVFINLIKMVIVPLIFFALLSGITSMNGEGNFTRVGLKGFGSYVITAVFAVIIGLSAGLLFKPGEGIDLHAILETSGAASTFVAKEPPSAIEFLLGLIPTNPLEAMVKDNFLQIIVFSIFTGITINLVGDKSKPLKEFIYSASQVSFKMIEIIIKLAPLGVFGFISWVVGTQGTDILESLAKLIGVVLLACVFQYFVFGLMILVFARMSPLPFYRKILFTQSIAFSTSSSKATLSTAMIQLQDRMGVSKSNSNFLMPLGVCINMDGTAIYLGICALFFSQAYGIELAGHDYLMLILTCTLGSMGAAGIPSGSIIFMGMVLSSVGLPIEGIGIILGIDRLLDMVRTTINITGDSAITLIVDKSEGSLNEKIYHSK
ncbi:MAG: dicarboxylate/amino acid:cation symporter [Pelagibacterales bacterium]|nr:dicarboxylate/amino acid:cation symporter [Pelagibacterales bacterium]